jgi:DNA-binding transcriptional LysR family regulator
VKPLTLEAIAKYPIVTYDPTFAGRTAVDRTFAARNLAPEVVLTALDSDVIKSYVSLGLGVGIISQRAFRAGKDEGLKALDCDHLFPAQTDTPRIQARHVPAQLRGGVHPPVRAARDRGGPEAAGRRQRRGLQHLAHCVL